MHKILIFFQIMMCLPLTGIWASEITAANTLNEQVEQSQINKEKLRMEEKALRVKINEARKARDKALVEKLQEEYLQLRRQNKALLREERASIKESRMALREEQRQTVILKKRKSLRK